MAIFSVEIIRERSRVEEIKEGRDKGMPQRKMCSATLILVLFNNGKANTCTLKSKELGEESSEPG